MQLLRTRRTHSGFFRKFCVPIFEQGVFVSREPGRFAWGGAALPSCECCSSDRRFSAYCAAECRRSQEAISQLQNSLARRWKRRTQMELFCGHHVL